MHRNDFRISAKVALTFDLVTEKLLCQLLFTRVTVGTGQTDGHTGRGVMRPPRTQRHNTQVIPIEARLIFAARRPLKHNDISTHFAPLHFWLRATCIFPKFVQRSTRTMLEPRNFMRFFMTL